MIKSFLTENDDEVQFEFKNNLASITSSTLEFEEDLALITRSIREKRLSRRYQNIADITVFLQDDQSSSDVNLTFVESRKKEINGLLEKRVFELITLDQVFENVRIFNSRFVDEIKHSGISQAFEKSRLVVQAYNDQEKDLVLTQVLTIQRMSQRIILVIASSTINDCHLYLRDITQAYVQSSISLNRIFFIRSSFELGLSDESILRVIKPLYEVFEADAH